VIGGDVRICFLEILKDDVFEFLWLEVVSDRQFGFSFGKLFKKSCI
jgi:hypothetical protein